MKLINIPGFLASCLLVFSHALPAQSQNTGTAGVDAQNPDPQGPNESTITYPSTYFTQYAPVSVNDMMSRIPGIGLALEDDQASRFGSGSDRGLGAQDQILINGKRLAGKANEARAQLDRISADQVDYIEIVRGSSGSLDVQNVGQLVNIVLLESLSSTTLAGQAGITHFEDGTVEPTGSLSLSGQSGSIDYLVSANLATNYEALDSFERSFLADRSFNETRAIDRVRDQQNISLNSNIVYQPSDSDRFALNALYGESDPPSELLRVITDLKPNAGPVVFEREDLPATSSNWEFGGDFQHNFSDGSRYRLLFIVNEKSDAVTRERFASTSDTSEETKTLFLDTDNRYRERIVRTSYSWNVAERQNLELGIEGAQTIQDSALKLGLKIPGTPREDYGGLVPADPPNAVSTVEEIRYEGFAIHNWQINPRMSLESSLLYETSEIEQTGETNKKRDFGFLKPKLDFRFDINPSFQLRMSAEKTVSQLSFADFSANTNPQDDDQDTLAGNPEIEPEETWRYSVILDYRLPNDGGVLNSRLFYFDVGNSIGRVDATTDPARPIGANGNVGDGKVFGLYLNASIRLGFLDLPQAVITANLNLEDAYLYDPLIAKKRTIIPYDRGNYGLGFRHDIPEYRLSYGFRYDGIIGGVGGTGGNRVRYDVDNVVFFGRGKVVPNLELFAEKVGFGNLTYRAQVNNALDFESCYERKRYTGYLRDGNLREIERYCTTVGPQFVFTVRGNF
ncbi:MAG: outer membrane beta-barrel protein [Gammaproteobacteria bacterium]|nr:outer membrane beta-barrel protein [Gammaproteobacteria bacterium]